VSLFVVFSGRVVVSTAAPTTEQLMRQGRKCRRSIDAFINVRNPNAELTKHVFFTLPEIRTN
jgi:hypothetical protein